MIRLGDALLLASTKLRTRKVRTIVTATLASLMFVSIVLAFSLMRGMINSYQNFTASSLSERYIANVMFFDDMGMSDNSSPELIAKAKTRHQQLTSEKAAEARRLGIDYDPRQEPAVTEKDEDGREYLNEQNQAARQVLDEDRRASQSNLAERTAELAAPYAPIAQYAFRTLGDTSGLKVMKDGREDLSAESAAHNKSAMYGNEPGIESIGYLPLSVSETYVLGNANRRQAKQAGDEIPVIVPYKQAEAALGLAPLERGASNNDRIERLEDVKRRAAGTIITACYRNSSSQQLIALAHQQAKEQQRNTGNAEYQPPSVQYGLPSDTSCEQAPIVKDTRSAAERAYADKQQVFAVKFGDEIEPMQRKLTFRIVGISPDMPDWGNASTLESLVMSIGGTTLQGQWVVPVELIDETLRDELLPGSGTDVNPWAFQTGNLIEFATADDIRRFVADKGCTGMDCGGSKPYIGYFGSNSVLIDDITRSITGVMKWVVLAIASIAAVLMAGMAGRVITDSRRETAVFRAIGARRNDIRLVYMLYMVMFASIVAALAVMLGLAIAWGLSLWQADNLTTLARLMFIESDYAGQYSLVGIWPLALLSVVGIIIATGLVAVLLPLARNLVRSPLRDMRDE